MQKRAMRCAVGLAAVVLVVCAGGISGAEATGQEQLLQTFQRGINHYQAGEFQQARQAFDRVLAMEPTQKMALEMRNMAELGIFFRMRDREELGPQADRLIELMSRAVREARREIKAPTALIEAFRSRDAVEYGRARIRLKSHGPYAVPYLAPLLALQGADEQYLAGRTFSLLADLHPDACLPLIQILTHADSAVLKERVAGVLGQIGDERAVPALLRVRESEDALESTREAAADAFRAITGKDPAEMSASASYADLALAYFQGDAYRVGYTYGMTADVWQWDADAADLPQKVVHQQVPNYLYYARMGAEVAWAGLSAAPEDTELQALLGASLVRQLALSRFYASGEKQFGGRAVSDEQKQDATARADRLSKEVPVVLGLLDAEPVGRALRMALDSHYAPTALFLVKALRTKLSIAELETSEDIAAQALAAAMDSGFKDVRYKAAVALVEGSPTGDAAPADYTMEVLAAALRAATAKRALVLVDDFMMRNKLSDLLKDGGLATLEVPVNEGSIESALHLEPSVDVVFLSNEVPELLMGSVMEKLASDPRTKGLPVYVVADPSGEGADVSGYDAVTKVLTADDVRAETLEPIIAEVTAESQSPFTEQEKAQVLDATRVLDDVDQNTTAYPAGKLQPALIDALTGYGDEVTAAAVDALSKFGGEPCLLPLSKVVETGSTDPLKVSACHAIASVLERTDVALPIEAADILEAAHAEGSQAVQEAAAEAIGSCRLTGGRALDLIRTEPLGLK